MAAAKGRAGAGAGEWRHLRMSRGSTGAWMLARRRTAEWARDQGPWPGAARRLVGERRRGRMAARAAWPGAVQPAPAEDFLVKRFGRLQGRPAVCNTDLPIVHSKVFFFGKIDSKVRDCCLVSYRRLQLISGFGRGLEAMPCSVLGFRCLFVGPNRGRRVPVAGC